MKNKANVDNKKINIDIKPVIKIKENNKGNNYECSDIDDPFFHVY